jgi:putative tryptophan/tyrosine transport system substrate-binding protein
MKRREFIILLCGPAFAWSSVVVAQQSQRFKRIGILMGTAETDGMKFLVRALLQQLQQLGWTEGQNLAIDYRWAGHDIARKATYAAELARLNPDVIVAESTPEARALRHSTSSVPIVFVTVTDPIESGLVESLSRPGGNLTGTTHFEVSIGGKWIEILREIVPHLASVMVIIDPDTPHEGYVRSADTAARFSGVALTPISVHDAAEIERAIDAFGSGPEGGLIVLPSIITATYGTRIIALAAKHELPAIYPFGTYVKGGGLISYGPNVADMYRRAASYVDRVLRGQKPAELPVEAPTRFELLINLNTAKALGLTVPPPLLTRADEVIE